MPFITEEIWRKLPMSRAVESIMLSPFPEPDTRLEDTAAEAEMAPVITAIEGLRNIRGESNLPPSARITAYVQSPDARTRELLERWRSYLMPLAGLGELRIGEPGAKPAQSAAFVGPRMEVFVPLAGLIDVDAERERLRKEITRSEQEVGGIKRKLDNPNFVAKAPPDVVEKDRARVEELEARITKLQDNLSRLSPESATPAARPEKPASADEEPAPARSPKPQARQAEAEAEVVRAESGAVEGEVVKAEAGAVEAEAAVKTKAVPEAKAPAREAPAKKAPAKKAAAKKAPAKKAPAKKAPAKKAPAKKRA
jgi:valyl-tRNA synthetase